MSAPSLGCLRSSKWITKVGLTCIIVWKKHSRKYNRGPGLSLVITRGHMAFAFTVRLPHFSSNLSEKILITGKTHIFALFSELICVGFDDCLRCVRGITVAFPWVVSRDLICADCIPVSDNDFPSQCLFGAAAALSSAVLFALFSSGIIVARPVQVGQF